MANCSECGAKADKNWDFCPQCGESLGKEQDAFSDIFERLGEEFAEVSKMLEKQVEAIDISPWFKKSRQIPMHGGRGFSIKITTSGNRQPQISVQTFGDINKKDLEKQVYGQFGVKAPQKIRVSEEKPTKLPTPKITEEPKTRVEKAGNKVLVEMELPGVRIDNIEIREFEGSVEVKAIVGDKAFFKILTKPENKRISSKKFERGILHLEFS